MPTGRSVEHNLLVNKYSNLWHIAKNEAHYLDTLPCYTYAACVVMIIDNFRVSCGRLMGRELAQTANQHVIDITKNQLSGRVTVKRTCQALAWQLSLPQYNVQSNQATENKVGLSLTQQCMAVANFSLTTDHHRKPVLHITAHAALP